MNISSTKFSHFPLLWLAIFFAAGILIPHWVALSIGFCLTAWAACTCLALTLRKGYTAGLVIGLAFTFAGALCLTLQNESISSDRVRAIYDDGLIASGEPVEIEGRLMSSPESAYDGHFLIVGVRSIKRIAESITTSGNVRVFVPARTVEDAEAFAALLLSRGAVVRFGCDLQREEKFQNPGVVSRIDILDRQGIDAVCTVKSPQLIEKISQEESWLPLQWIFDCRQNLIDDFRQRFEPATAGVMIASLLGDKYFLDKDTADVFREGGTFHVLVISGLHITFIGGLALLLVRLFTKRKLVQILGACSFLWVYTFAVGAEVPVVRASIMFTVIALSQVVRRKGSLLNSLGLCALMLLVWKPDDLFSASFQLTFASVTAIAAIGFPAVEKMRAIGKWTPSTEMPFPPRVPAWFKRFCEMLYWRDEVSEIEQLRQIWSARIFKRPFLKRLNTSGLRAAIVYLVEGVVISAIVQIWLLPFGVIYFHRITPAGIFLNLWVGICIALESFLAVAAVLLGHISEFLAVPFVRLTELLNWFLITVPKFLTDGNLAGFRLPAYTQTGRLTYIIYFVPVLFLAVAIYRWNPFSYRKKSNKPTTVELLFGRPFLAKGAAIILVCIVAVVILHPFSAPAADGRLHIDFLDVGQGDSALVTFPNGETMLVDGGGQITFRTDDSQPMFEPDAPRIGEAVVSEFLWERGYSKIDYILATHADADHIQGLTDVAQNFGIREAFFARMPMSNQNYAELAVILHKRNIAISRLSRGDLLLIGGVGVEILFPNDDPEPDSVSDNDHSLVLRLIYGSRRFLLTGDVERKAENEMLAIPKYLTADIVKVPHHGSKTSSTEHFVNAVKPQLAIISVGRRSRFGHPNKEVVERWRNGGARVMTTGKNGTISASTDGADLVIKTFLETDSEN